jgi:hypothetical protein
MADPLDLLRASARFGDRAAGSLGSALLHGGAAPAGRIVHKAAVDPDEGDYFQLAFGFIPSGNLGSWLGIENPFGRLALDVLADPFNAVNLVPFLGATMKSGRAAASARFLSAAEKGDQARRVLQVRGLSGETGRGLEFMSAVARNDVRTLRRMRDLFVEGDEATLSFFRGERGRALRNSIFSDAPEYVQLERGLVQQVQKGQRAAFVGRIPFTDIETSFSRIPFTNLELPFMRGEWLARPLQKTKYLNRWLENVGDFHIQEIQFALHTADAADSAFNAAHALADAGAEIADITRRSGRPELSAIGEQTERLVDDLGPLHAEYRAAKTANELQFADLQTQLDRHETRINAVARDASKGRLDGAVAYLAEASAVAGSSDITPAFEPMLAAYRQGLSRLAPLVPAEYRRLFAEYANALDQAIADPGKARALAGTNKLRELAGLQRAELGEIAARLEGGQVPTPEQAAKRPIVEAARERLVGQAQAEAGVAESRRAQVATRRETVVDAIEELNQRLARTDKLIDQVNRQLTRLRPRRPLGEGVPPNLLRARPLESASERLNRLVRSRAELLARQDTLESELRLIDEDLGRGVPSRTGFQAERAVAQPTALGLPPGEALELTREQKLTRAAAKSIRGSEGLLAKLESALPDELAKNAPDSGRILGVAQEMSDRLARAATELPKIAAEAKKLAGRTKLGIEPLVARINAGISAITSYVGIVRGGKEAAALRETIERTWPELGKELKEAHRARELSVTSRALESDVLAAWNPTMSHDWGGAGRGLRNLYGAGPDPRNFADGYVAYEGQTLFRVDALLERHAPAFRRLSKNEDEAIAFMRGFKLSGREELAFLDTLDDEQVALFKALRRILTGAEAIGHGRWYEHAISGYFPIVTRPGRLGEAAYQEALQGLVSRHRSSVKSRHFLPRISESIDDALKLEKLGILKVEKDPRKIIKGYMDALTRVAANQRLFDQLTHGRGLDGLPLMIERGREATVRAALGFRPEDLRYVDVDPKKYPALAGMKIHADHADILDVFGPRNVSEVIREDTPFWRALMRVNLAWKGAVLSMSFFHAVAQATTIALYTNPLKGAKFLAAEFLRSPLGARVAPALASKANPERLSALLHLYGQSGELVEQAIRHGMEWDTFDKLASTEFRGFFVNLIDEVTQGKGGAPASPVRRVLTSPLTGLKHFNDLAHQATWEYVHNSGKVFLYAEGLQRLMKVKRHIPFDQLAKEAAGSANRALGGLNWRKMFGDARFRARLQAFMLAPDWTLANLAQARDFFVGAFAKGLQPDARGRLPLPVRDITSPEAAGLLARRMWLNWGLYAFITMQAMNQATVGRFTWENPEGAKLAVDLGYKDEKGRPIKLSFGKQFLEPFELVDDPLRFLLGKTAPVPSAISTIVMQRDRFGGQITVPKDSTSQKVLNNLGWVGTSFFPIAGQSLIRAGKQFAKGQTEDAVRTAIGAGTGMFDIQIRPVPLLEGQPSFEAAEPSGANDDDLPRSLPRHILPKRQVRFVFPRD